MLVSDLIDRTLAEWLYPGGSGQPMYDVLAATITDVGTTVTLEGRAERIARDSVLEIGSELLLVKSSSGSTVEVAERGHLNTVAANHNDGDIVRIDPTFTRKGLLDAMRAVMSRFYAQGLYVRNVDSGQTYRTYEVLSLPSGGKEILSILIRDSGSYETYTRLNRKGEDWLLYREWDPPKYQLRRGGNTGAAMRVVYTTDFTLPTDEGDDLGVLGVSETLQEGLSLAVAGHVLRGREVPRVVLDRIRQQLEAQNIPVSAAQNVGEAMLAAFRRDHIVAERRRQTDLDPPAFEWVR